MVYRFANEYSISVLEFDFIWTIIFKNIQSLSNNLNFSKLILK